MCSIKRINKNKLWFSVLLLQNMYLCRSAMAQQPDQGYIVDQRPQWVTIITDSALINLFVDELYISEDHIEKLEVIDANNNGFTRGDLLKAYPSEEIYFIDEPSERLQSEMDKWKFQANCQLIYDHRRTAEMIEQMSIQQAEHSILASFIRGVNRNYRDFPLKAWIERDSTGIKFEMWGYSDKQLQYSPPPPVGYDIVTVYKTVIDTVFIPIK